MHRVRLGLRADLLSRRALVNADGRDADGPRRVPDRDADVHVRGFPVVPLLHALDDEEERALDVHRELAPLYALEQRPHVLLAQPAVRHALLPRVGVHPVRWLGLQLALPLLDQRLEVRGDLIDGFRRLRRAISRHRLRRLREGFREILIFGTPLGTPLGTRAGRPGRGGLLRGGRLLGGEFRRGDAFLPLPLGEFLERPQLGLLLVRLRAGRPVLLLGHRVCQLRLRVVQTRESVAVRLPEERRGLAEASQTSNRVVGLERGDVGIERRAGVVRGGRDVLRVIVLGSLAPVVFGCRGGVVGCRAGPAGSHPLGGPRDLRPLRPSLRLLLLADLGLARGGNLRALDVLGAAKLLGLGLALARDLRREKVHRGDGRSAPPTVALTRIRRPRRLPQLPGSKPGPNMRAGNQTIRVVLGPRSEREPRRRGHTEGRKAGSHARSRLSTPAAPDRGSRTRPVHPASNAPGPEHSPRAL